MVWGRGLCRAGLALLAAAGGLEGRGQGVIEGGLDLGQSLVEVGQEGWFGLGRQRGHIDGEGPGFEGQRQVEIFGDGQEDGAAEPKLDGVRAAFFPG